MKKQLLLMFALFFGTFEYSSLLQAMPPIEKSDKTNQGTEQSIPSPKNWLQQGSNALLDELDQHLDEFKNDQQSLEQFLYQKALPYWDTRLMSKGLAGKYWYKSNPKLRKELQLNWNWTLVRYFVTAFKFYHGQRLDLENRVKCSIETRCWLRTVVSVVGKEDVNIDFYAHLTKHRKSKSNQLQWHLIDIRVAGISIIKHKKGETRQILHQKGIQGLISALSNKNKKNLKMILVNNNDIQR